MKDKFLNILKSSKLNLTNLYLTRDFGSEIKKSISEISPKDFLRFAKQDLKEGNEKGFINSLTNSKRAIDCQVDNTLDILGIKSYDFNKEFKEYVNLFEFEDDIPIKLKIIHSINLAPSLIISKTRTLRNKLEHIYQKPKSTDVKEALDIADLFIRSVEGKMTGIFTEFYLTDDKNCNEESNWEVFTHLYFNYSPDERNFTISLKSKLHNDDNIEEVVIDANDGEFCGLLNLMFSNTDDFESEDAVKKILKFIGHSIPPEKVNIEVE
jgi:hypothetical protein